VNPEFAIGIDLGTSTSEICIYRRGVAEVVPDAGSQGKSPIVPSIVAEDEKNNKIIVGERARNYASLRGNAVAEAKRLMGSGKSVELGNRSYAPEDISAAILHHLAGMARDYLGGKEIRDVAISVPANFNEAQRAATKRAGEKAGLNVVRIINEPTAAALAFAHENIDVEGRIAVFDFGGGTLDVTIFDMSDREVRVLATYGDTELGGREFDNVLVDLIRGRFMSDHPGAILMAKAVQNKLKPLAEQVKIELSSSETAEAFLPYFGMLDGDPIDLEIDITRAEFEQASEDLLDRSRECIAAALLAADVERSSIDTVLLVGGSTYIPAVRAMVGRFFGKLPAAIASPDLAVCMGTALHAADAADLVDHGNQSPVLHDVCSHGLGTDIRVQGDARLVYDALISPNTPVPWTVERVYELMSTDQDRLRLCLYESHSGDAYYVDEARHISEATITGIPQAHGEPHEVRVEFTYDAEQMVTLQAVIVGTSKRCEIHHAVAASADAGSTEGVDSLVSRMS
jgi:molecular chaperone DnaK